jgi:diphosphomevalonate decarboxylase
VAVARALGIEEDHDLSVLARLSGSGSAARSVYGGFVEWPTNTDRGEGELAPARQLAPAGHWPLACVIAVLEAGPKEVSSLDGHRRATTSPHFARRLERVPERLESVRGALRDRDLSRLGPVLERDAIELHTIAMTSEPAIFYWSPGTLEVLAAVRELRQDGIDEIGAYSTMDAGATVHVICEPESAAAGAGRLGAIGSVREVIRDRAGDGPRPEAEELL